MDWKNYILSLKKGTKYINSSFFLQACVWVLAIYVLPYTQILLSLKKQWLKGWCGYLIIGKYFFSQQVLGQVQPNKQGNAV